jgi:hypothetical protein
MAGIAIVLDLLRKNPSLYTGQSLHSYGLFSATAAASAAAAAISAGTPFASRALFGYSLSLSHSLSPQACVCVQCMEYSTGLSTMGMANYSVWLLFFEYGNYLSGLVVLLDCV